MKKTIVVRTSFEAVHAWPKCPFPSVQFLKWPHRHIFHVEARAEIKEDRGIEFIILKRSLEAFISEKYKGKDLGVKSCEVMGEEVLAFFPELNYISIFEDNENGSIVEK